MKTQSKDEEVREVVAELEGLLSKLRTNVAALTAVLSGTTVHDRDGEGSRDGQPA